MALLAGRAAEGVSAAPMRPIDYRWLDIDYSTGENATRFKYDVLTQGPVLGFGVQVQTS